MLSDQIPQDPDLETAVEIARDKGWFISKTGSIDIVPTVHGFDGITPRLRYGFQPEPGLAFGGYGTEPIVLSRFTPDLPNTQKLQHLLRTIATPNGPFTFNTLISKFLTTTPGFKGTKANPLYPFTIPMVDCFPILPLSDNDDPIYMAGVIPTGQRDGMAFIVDKGKWYGVSKIAGSTYPIIASADKAMYITTLTPEGNKQQVFTIDGAIPTDQIEGPHTLWNNSITVLALVSSKKDQGMSLPRINLDCNEPVLSYSTTRSSGGLALGHMGQNTDTGATGQFGNVPDTLKFPIIINIIPIVARDQRSLPDTILRLTSGN